MYITHLSKPIGIGQGEIGEGALALNEVPGGAHVVIPGDDPLHGVAHHVDVDGGGQVESAEERGRKCEEACYRTTNLIAATEITNPFLRAKVMPLK